MRLSGDENKNFLGDIPEDFLGFVGMEKNADSNITKLLETTQEAVERECKEGSGDKSWWW